MKTKLYTLSLLEPLFGQITVALRVQRQNDAVAYSPFLLQYL